LDERELPPFNIQSGNADRASKTVDSSLSTLGRIGVHTGFVYAVIILQQNPEFGEALMIGH
jgi:hypothetical protein